MTERIRIKLDCVLELDGTEVIWRLEQAPLTGCLVAGLGSLGIHCKQVGLAERELSLVESKATKKRKARK